MTADHEIQVICNVLFDIAGMSADEQAEYLASMYRAAVGDVGGNALVLNLFESGDIQSLVANRQARGSCQRGRA